MGSQCGGQPCRDSGWAGDGIVCAYHRTLAMVKVTRKRIVAGSGQEISSGKSLHGYENFLHLILGSLLLLFQCSCTPSSQESVALRWVVCIWSSSSTLRISRRPWMLNTELDVMDEPGIICANVPSIKSCVESLILSEALTWRCP